MSRKMLSMGVIAVLAAAFGLVGAAQGGTADFFKRLASTITLNSAPPASEFSGKVSAKEPCRGGRTVVVKSALDKSLLAKTTTNPDGTWAAPSNFIGTAFGKVRWKFIPDPDKKDGERTVVCKANRSSDVAFGAAPTPKADLSLTKTAKTPPPGHSFTDASYTIRVTNNGPNDAQNVVVTDTGTFVPMAGPTTDHTGRFVPSTGPAPNSDSRCQASGSQVVCNLGTVPAGTTVSLVLVFMYNRGQECTDGTDNDSATVSSSTPDPTLPDNTGTAQTNIVCD